MADRQDDLTPEQRVRRAEAQQQDAAARRPEVERLFNRLRRHLEENHFADRLYQQMSASRRQA